MPRNKTTTMAAIALVASIAAFGFVAYGFFYPPQETPEPGIKNTWYKEYLYTISCPSSEAWYVASMLRISFDVAEGESVLVSYTGLVRLDDTQAHTWVEVCLNIDGAAPALTQPYQRVEDYTHGAGNWTLTPVSLQCSLSLPAGAHNVTMQFHGYRILDSVRQSTLLVQTYIP